MNVRPHFEFSTSAQTDAMVRKILIAEDDLTLLKGLELNLKREGYEVLTAKTGSVCINIAIRQNPTLILLDLMLPDASGIDVCRELRMKGIDSIVLMLTVKSQELDRVLGLEMGADDYMTKPFSLPELLARIRAHLRRAPAMPSDSVSRYRFGDIEIDFKKLLVTRNGKVLEMTAKEFDLIRLLVSARGEVVTRERILEVVWGYQSYPSTRTVDNFILQLRHKLEPERAKPRYILSVYGEGYKFVG